MFVKIGLETLRSSVMADTRPRRYHCGSATISRSALQEIAGSSTVSTPSWMRTDRGRSGDAVLVLEGVGGCRVVVRQRKAFTQADRAKRADLDGRRHRRVPIFFPFAITARLAGARCCGSPSSRTRSITSVRNPSRSAEGCAGSWIPLYAHRPRCSTNEPNRRATQRTDGMSGIDHDPCCGHGSHALANWRVTSASTLAASGCMALAAFGTRSAYD
jgi:hypothetical protein